MVRRPKLRPFIFAFSAAFLCVPGGKLDSRCDRILDRRARGETPQSRREIPAFSPNFSVQILFLFQISKIRDKFQRSIYNLQSHRQLRKPCGWFSISLHNRRQHHSGPAMIRRVS
jgi:hypothetical protein